MNTLLPTRHDLSVETRAAMVALLNQQLATSIHLSVQAKLAHWNVKGPHFLTLHGLFDQVYTSAGEWSDTIAERAAALGGFAEAELGQVYERTGLKPHSAGTTRGRAHVEALADSLAAFGRGVRAAIDAAAQAGDAGTSDLFTGISREVDKTLWFVESHLHG